MNESNGRKEKERPQALALYRISYPQPCCPPSLPPFLPLPEAGTLGLLLILQPQGVCLSESLPATAIWISLRSYYPLKQGSTTSLAQVPQIGNKRCQRHQSGQKNIFPIFRKASPAPIGTLASCFIFLKGLYYLLPLSLCIFVIYCSFFFFY